MLCLALPRGLLLWESTKCNALLTWSNEKDKNPVERRRCCNKRFRCQVINKTYTKWNCSKNKVAKETDTNQREHCSYLNKSFWMRASTNIFVVVIIPFGMIGIIGAWWIMASFVFWKIMLGIPVGVMVLLNRGNFVIKITTTSPICQSGMFNGISFDCEFQKWKITRIMGCLCTVLSGCYFDSCQCLHWDLDLEQLWHFICLLFNHMTFASSFLLHVEVGWLVKKVNPLLEDDFFSDGRLH